MKLSESNPPDHARKKLPTVERWRAIFAGSYYVEDAVGAADDARRIAARGEAVLQHVKRGGRGYPSLHQSGMGSGRGGHGDLSEQTGDDGEGQAREMVHRALAAAKELRAIRQFFDSFVPEVAPKTVPIGERPATSTPCMICDDIVPRLIRGMCPACLQEYRDAGWPDIEQYKLERRGLDATQAATAPDYSEWQDGRHLAAAQSKHPGDELAARRRRARVESLQRQLAEIDPNRKERTA